MYVLLLGPVGGPKKICRGPSATKVPKGSGVKEFYRIPPIVLAKVN